MTRQAVYFAMGGKTHDLAATLGERARVGSVVAYHARLQNVRPRFKSEPTH